CRGGFGLSLRWAEGALLEAELTSDLGEPCVIRLGDRALALHMPAGGRKSLTAADFGQA
ncbi:MAG: hypothetical protein JHC99_10315, partial [Brevundimonas sp.]|nr:hypothetical protein [Brevundimonas sp.]